MPWKLLPFLSDFSHLITNLRAKHCWHEEMIYWLLDAFNSFLIKIYDICQAYDSLVWTALLSTTWTNSQISDFFFFFLVCPNFTFMFHALISQGTFLSLYSSAVLAILLEVSEWTVRLMFRRVFMESGVSARLLMRGIIMSCLFTHPVRMH